ncbi:MAG: hypothetical protein Q7S68_06075 [Deltaproteobacteria bacterium]|nr:hypothetical protein [Deltaproteobacteria bacterium]
MRLTPIVLVLFLLGGAQAGLAGDPKNPPKKAAPSQQLDSDPYVSQTFNFKIRPPKGWKQSDRTVPEFGNRKREYVYFYSPSVDGEGRKEFHAKLSVEARPIDLANAEYLIDDMIRDLTERQVDWKLIKKGPFPLRGIPDAYRMIGTYSAGQTRVKVIYIAGITGPDASTKPSNKGFEITAIAIDSAWDKYKDLFEAAIADFKVE